MEGRRGERQRDGEEVVRSKVKLWMRVTWRRWMNHFVTELEGYGSYAPYMFQYYNLMQTHALGNFKEFVRAVGINSAMLIYLNGFENTSNNPNENYARPELVVLIGR